MEIEEAIQMLGGLSEAQLNQLRDRIPDIVEGKRKVERSKAWDERDTRLEECVQFLARQCDGAESLDGFGFNRNDAAFGHRLANEVQDKRPWVKSMASAAYRMIQKYRHTQLEPNGFEIPKWEEIESQYFFREMGFADELDRQLREYEENGDRTKYGIFLYDNRLVLASPYDPSVVERCRAVDPTRRHAKFDRPSATWQFNRLVAIKVHEKFPPETEEFEWTNEAICFVLEQIQEAENERYEQEQRRERERTRIEEFVDSVVIPVTALAKVDEPLPDGRKLMEHQKIAVRWLLHRQRGGIYPGAILGDDMGLGKTLSALCAAKALSEISNAEIIVIAPVSVHESWRREAQAIGLEKINMFSWASVPVPLSSEYIAIADEAHSAQNFQSQRTKRLLALAQHKNCRAIWMLTGTPMKNGKPENIFPLLEAGSHRLCRKDGRRKAYLEYKGKQKQPSYLDKFGDELSDYLLRRTKEECLDLPDLTRIPREAELSDTEQRQYAREVREELQTYRDKIEKLWQEVREEPDPEKAEALANQALGKENAAALVSLNVLRKIGERYKIASSIALAQELIDQGEQVVLFSAFKDPMVKAAEALNGQVLSGDVPAQKRQKIVDDFQSGFVPAIAGTIQTAGLGLTLTNASYVIFNGRPWTPGEVVQAEDRLRRIGQKSAVSSFWISYGDVDEKIDGKIEQKQANIDRVLEGKSKVPELTSKDLIEEIMKIYLD